MQATITIAELQRENDLLKERLAEATAALLRADTELRDKDEENAALVHRMERIVRLVKRR